MGCAFINKWAVAWRQAALILMSLSATSCTRSLDLPSSRIGSADEQPKDVRVVLLHHSVGEAIWNGGLASFVADWNASHGSQYEISELTYPNTLGGHAAWRRIVPERVFMKLFDGRYPWNNYPYDYWNLWVAHAGERHDRFELNLDELARSFDVIVFKHCYPVSGIEGDDGRPDVSSHRKTLANYRLQYEALKNRMKEFPRTKFIVWTTTGLTKGLIKPAQAERARQFAAWIKNGWDVKGDNIYVWDFRQLQTEGDLYVRPENAEPGDEVHPSKAFARRVAPMLGRRIVDVIEGRGDVTSLTGQ